MSLVASFVSGITLLGTSTEIYIYGTQYAFVLVGPAVMGVFMHFVIVPVFYELKVVSMFEVSNVCHRDMQSLTRLAYLSTWSFALT
jgi:Na+/proline symporter